MKWMVLFPLSDEWEGCTSIPIVIACNTKLKVKPRFTATLGIAKTRGKAGFLFLGVRNWSKMGG